MSAPHPAPDAPDDGLHLPWRNATRGLERYIVAVDGSWIAEITPVASESQAAALLAAGEQRKALECALEHLRPPGRFPHTSLDECLRLIDVALALEKSP